jgi:hypothetical protein
MKADNFIKILRKIIREEVQAVVREELGLLLETSDPKPVVTETKNSTVKNSMVESIKTTKPTQPLKPTTFTQNNILNEILNETAQSGEWKSIAEMKSGDAIGFAGATEPSVVSSVTDMLANTRPAGDINAVRIDVVPDFTGLMTKMKQEGQI